MLLMISNAVSKILGAVFKIPLTYIIGEEGMAVYNSAFGIYIMFLSFIISGLPFAVSKLVSEYSASGDIKKLSYTVRLSNAILLFAGVFGSLCLYFFADFFALAVREEKAVFAIKMIAPSVFFVALGTTARSYFQGISNMLPTAVSQITEAVIKLGAGYILAVKLSPLGIPAAAGGAVLGVAIGEAAATAVFLGAFIFSRHGFLPCHAEDKKSVRTALFNIAVPLLFSAVVSSLLSVADTGIMRAGLIDYGCAPNEARRVYGAYTGYAMTVLHLPVGILATLGVSILPVIAGSLSVNDMRRARHAARGAVMLSVVMSVPCSVIVFFMSDELLSILFGNSTSSVMLAASAPCIIMLSVINIITAMLRSAGKIITVFAYTSVLALLKILMCAVLMPAFGIYGAIASSNICCFLELIVSVYIIKKKLGLKFGISETIIKPALGAAAMILCISLVKEPLLSFIKKDVFAAAVICVFSLSVYAGTLALSGSAALSRLFLLGRSKNS